MSDFIHEVSAPILVLPAKMGGWHIHAHVYDGDRYTTSCWNQDCWEREHVIKQNAEDLALTWMVVK
jgi:hypothetical protein